MTGKSIPPWRKSIRSNASSGCVEVTWIDGAFPDDLEAVIRPSK